jgi:hypothetical protein
MNGNYETPSVTRATMKFSGIELRLLAALASDQLFRREFIDPRMPGYKSNPTELSLGKKLVERLRFTADRAERIPSTRRNGAVL